MIDVTIDPPTRYIAPVLAPAPPALDLLERPTESLSRTGPLIEALWNTANNEAEPWEFHSIDDTEPDIDRHPIRRFAGALLVTAGLVLGGLAVWRLTDASTSVPALGPAQTQLTEARAELAPLLESLSRGIEVDPVALSARISDAGAAGRSLFSATSTVTEPSERAALLAQAETVLTVVERMEQANMLESITIPILAPPTLPKTATPEEAAELAGELAVWQAALADTLALIPSHPDTVHALERISALVAGLDEWKAGYFDSLREGNDPSAALASLENEIETVRTAIEDTVVLTAAAGLGQLETLAP